MDALNSQMHADLTTALQPVLQSVTEVKERVIGIDGNGTGRIGAIQRIEKTFTVQMDGLAKDIKSGFEQVNKDRDSIAKSLEADRKMYQEKHDSLMEMVDAGNNDKVEILSALKEVTVQLNSVQQAQSNFKQKSVLVDYLLTSTSSVWKKGGDVVIRIAALIAAASGLWIAANQQWNRYHPVTQPSKNTVVISGPLVPSPAMVPTKIDPKPEHSPEYKK